MGGNPLKKSGWAGIKKIVKSSTALTAMSESTKATAAGNRSYTCIGRLQLKHTLEERMAIISELFERFPRQRTA